MSSRLVRNNGANSSITLGITGGTSNYITGKFSITIKLICAPVE